MFSFFALTNFILLASYASAAPASPGNATHIMAKRDAVCGADFRNAVNYNSCLPNNVAYTLVPPSQIVPVPTAGGVPAGMQCDHVIELNFVNSILTDSGLCSILGPLAKADPTQTKDVLFDSMADHLSALLNLNFVDQNVNNQKKTAIQRAYKGAAQGNTVIDFAVGNYLTSPIVLADSNAVAQNVDNDIAVIIATANIVLAGLPAGKGGRDPVTVKKTNLANAIAAYVPTSVLDTWQDVVAVVPHN